MMSNAKEEATEATEPSPILSAHMLNEDTVGQVRDLTDVEKARMQDGAAHFNRLGWKRLTVVLIVEAIALGSLGMPQAFATLGMIAGTILCVGLGLLAIYSSYVVGQVKLKYLHIQH